MIQRSRRRVAWVVVSLLGHRPSSIVVGVGFDSGLQILAKNDVLKKHVNHLVLTRHTCKNRTTIICPNLGTCMYTIRSYFLTDYQETAKIYTSLIQTTRGHSIFFRSLHQPVNIMDDRSVFPIGYVVDMLMVSTTSVGS